MTRSLMLRNLEPHDFGRTISDATDLGELLDGDRKSRDVISLGL